MDHERSQEGYGALKIAADVESHYENANDPSRPEKTFYFGFLFRVQVQSSISSVTPVQRINKVTTNPLEIVR